MRRLLAGAVIAAALSGCAVMNKWQVHPGSQVISRCHHWGWGWLGTPIALYQHQQCLAEHERMGFVTVSDGAVKAAVQTRCGEYWPGDIARQAICQDEYMTALKKGKIPPGRPGETASDRAPTRQ